LIPERGWYRIGIILALILSALALHMAYTRGRVPLGDYLETLEGDRDGKAFELNMYKRELQASRDRATLAIEDLIRAIDNPDRPDITSPGKAKWNAEQLLKSWSGR